MTRTKQEVRDYLNRNVGLTIPDKVYPALNGQCVAEIKGLMDFLGVPNPYKARGNAKDAGDTYLAEGIADNGSGWLTVAINPSMGNGYGHIWADLAGEANFEQNGAVPLKVTKNTRPIKDARQLINFDKWITKEEEVRTFTEANRVDFNVGVFNTDIGLGKGAVGKEYGDAVYQILSSQDFKNNQFVNSGDVTNVNALFKRNDANKMQGKTFKVLHYDYTVPNFPSSSDQYELAQVYVKKK